MQGRLAGQKKRKKRGAESGVARLPAKARSEPPEDGRDKEQRLLGTPPRERGPANAVIPDVRPPERREDAFLLFQAPRFVVICYGSHKNRIQVIDTYGSNVKTTEDGNSGKSCFPREPTFIRFFLSGVSL